MFPPGFSGMALQSFRKSDKYQAARGLGSWLETSLSNPLQQTDGQGIKLLSKTGSGFLLACQAAVISAYPETPPNIRRKNVTFFE